MHENKDIKYKALKKTATTMETTSRENLKVDS